MAANDWPIGSDVTENLTGLTAGGSYLNSATVTYTITTLTGTAVSGGTGSYTYTAASNGDYTAVIESTVTSTLTANTEYLLTVTISSGSYNKTEYLRRTARKASVALATLADWKTFTGTTTTDTTRDASICSILSMVDAAIRRYIKPFVPVPTTITGRIMDAPRGNVLLLPVTPARSITSIYLRWGADGQDANFTSDDLLDTDQYYMPVDTDPEGYSRSGIVYRRGSSSWAHERVRSVGRLGYRIDPNRGALKVSFEAGPASVPEDLQEATLLATSLIYNRRKFGAPVTSESWNGASYSLAGPFLVGALASPDVAAILLRYSGGVPTGVG